VKRLKNRILAVLIDVSGAGCIWYEFGIKINIYRKDLAGMDFKRFLILTELDKLSAKATSFAVHLAEKMNISEIILLNLIVPAHSQAFSTSGALVATDSKMTGLMEKHLNLTRKEADRFATKNVRIQPVARYHDRHSNLNKYMEEFDAGLVVCGSHDGHSCLTTLFGSGNGKLVRKVDYPLIIIKDEADVGEIQNILVAIDISEEDQSGLSEIAAFAGSLNVTMHLLHVLTDDSYSSDQAIKKLRKLAIDNMFGDYNINVVNRDSLEDGIRSFSRKHNPDMIAVLSQGKGKIHNLVFGSSTEDIIKEADKPVFVSKIN
jgi:nucleotide-binding universal stress UspA family protein